MSGLGLVTDAVEGALGGAAGFFANLAANVFTGALSAVSTAVIYHDLRVVKEGVSVEELVRVFE